MMFLVAAGGGGGGTLTFNVFSLYSFFFAFFLVYKYIGILALGSCRYLKKSSHSFNGSNKNVLCVSSSLKVSCRPNQPQVLDTRSVTQSRRLSKYLYLFRSKSATTR